MSGYKTHSAIGAVGGAVLDTAIRIGADGVLIHGSVDPLLQSVTLVVASALLSLWPDLDHPESYLAKHASWGTIPFGAWGGFLAATWIERSMPAMAIGVGLGMIGGLGLGLVLPQIVSAIAGGHRRGTHSFVTSIGLIVIGLLVAIVLPSAAWVAVVMLGLVWGQILHVLGDVVTPAGVPLAYPLSSKAVRVLPYGLAAYGETIAQIATALVLVGVVIVNLKYYW